MVYRSDLNYDQINKYSWLPFLIDCNLLCKSISSINFIIIHCLNNYWLYILWPSTCILKCSLLLILGLIEIKDLFQSQKSDQGQVAKYFMLVKKPPLASASASPANVGAILLAEKSILSFTNHFQNRSGSLCVMAFLLISFYCSPYSLNFELYKWISISLRNSL